jgi:hypothetical protein
MSSSLFEYLGAAMTLAAAIVGTLGKTTDDAKQGMAHITPRGWIAVVAALVGGLVSAIAITKNNQEKLQAEQDREQIRLIALDETEWALNLLLRPFSQLHPDAYDTRFNRGTVLAEAGAFRAFCKLNPRSPVTDADPHLPWGLFVHDVFKEGSDELQNVVTRYSSYLDAETILRIERVRNDPKVRAFVLGHGMTELAMKENGMVIPFCGLLGDTADMDRLAATVQALEKHLRTRREPLVKKYGEIQTH